MSAGGVDIRRATESSWTWVPTDYSGIGDKVKML